MIGSAGIPPEEAAQVLAYRKRARELRVFADEYTDADMRRNLLLVADRWDEMAERVERRWKWSLGN